MSESGRYLVNSTAHECDGNKGAGRANVLVLVGVTSLENDYYAGSTGSRRQRQGLLRLRGK
jgi:hypothetical protein